MKTRRSVRVLAVALFAMAAAGTTLIPSSPLGGTAYALPACVISPTNVVITSLDITAAQNRCFATNKARLIFQSDGNLVVYDEFGRARFASNTVGRGQRLILQSDGNLVIYDAANRPVFATNTAGHPHDRLVVQTDGNVVIYTCEDKPVFATNTQH